MYPSLDDAPLGKKSSYISYYDASLLCPLPRKKQRDEIGISHPLPFTGNDIWNGFELSWLNAKGKPVVAAAEFIFPCSSSHLIESKSFKLYLNSFNNTLFDSFDAVQSILMRDLSAAANAVVQVKLFPLSFLSSSLLPHFTGTCLDDLDISCETYQIAPYYLSVENHSITETVYSDLLKSNCLVTGQPDWASIKISYTGQKIQHEGLLKYLISYRNHNEFHEQCVERIFMDILRSCKPEKLLVYARYTRRGGLDINPYRANYPHQEKNERLCRQ